MVETAASNSKLMGTSTPQKPTIHSNSPVSFVSPLHQPFDRDEHNHDVNEQQVKVAPLAHDGFDNEDNVSSKAGKPTNKATDKAPLVRSLAQATRP